MVSTLIGHARGIRLVGSMRCFSHHDSARICELLTGFSHIALVLLPTSLGEAL